LWVKEEESGWHEVGELERRRLREEEDEREEMQQGMMHLRGEEEEAAAPVALQVEACSTIYWPLGLG